MKTLEAVEREHILRTFQELNHNRVKTAVALGIGLRTLQRKLTSYGVALGDQGRNREVSARVVQSTLDALSRAW